ncbi:MAG: hypothetical protein JW954_01240 [Dehalococcoidaceae bacterium]|nr:hypothetical protein [Dehalococcoidaceae bacterium]
MLKMAGETPAGVIRQHEKQVSAHFQPVVGPAKAGEYITDLPVQGAASYSPDAGRLYAGIFVAMLDLRLDRLALNVSGAAPEGKQARLGIYRCGRDLYPDELILDGGLAYVDSTGLKSVSIDQALRRGYYFLAVMVEENCSLKYLKLCRSPLGMYSSFTAVYSGYSAASEWGPLPAVFPGEGTIANVFRLVGARLAGLEAW